MKLRRILGALGLALLVLLLIACSSISSGRITEKVIEAPYTWVQMVCSGYDAKGNCTVQVPIYHNEPEKYRFDIENEDGETGWVYVQYGTFESHKVGDWVDFSGN